MNNQHEITGEILYISPKEKLTDNLNKITVAIGVPNGNRNETIPFEFYNPSNNLDKFAVGNRVHITFKSKGNRAKQDPTKFYPSNEAINMNKI